VSSGPNAASAISLQFPSNGMALASHFMVTEATVNANRLIEEWRRQGRVPVEGRTRSCGGRARERALFVFMGFHFRLSLSKLLPELPAAGLRGSLLICRDWVCRSAGRFRLQLERVGHVVSQSIDAAGIRNFHLVVHDIGGLSGLMSFGAFPIELNRSRFSIHSSM